MLRIPIKAAKDRIPSVRPINRVARRRTTADGRSARRYSSYAAIYGNRRARHVGAQICRQKFNDAGAILGSAVATQCHRLKPMFAHRIEKRRDPSESNRAQHNSQ